MAEMVSILRRSRENGAHEEAMLAAVDRYPFLPYVRPHSPYVSHN